MLDFTIRNSAIPFKVPNPVFALVSEDVAPPDLITLIEDEYARAILAETDQRPMSAPTLAETCDASRPTIYRRINWLKDHDLLAESMEPDDDGHHRKVYKSRFQRVSVQLDDGTYTITVDRREDPADRFTELWEGI